MTIDEALRQTVRSHLKGMRRIEEKPMIGGVAFTWRGNLLCGVMGDSLLVRIARADYDEYIRDRGAHPMIMAGKTGKSWILVHKSAVSRTPELKKWIDRAIEFGRSLPPKEATRKGGVRNPG